MTDFISPIHTPLSQEMDVDLVVKPDGTLWLFYDKPLAHIFSWAEYDGVEKSLYLVDEMGQMQNIGLEIPENIDQYLRNSKQINLGYVQDKLLVERHDLAIVIRDI